MESAIVKKLKPEFPPVAVVWSNTIPDDAIQFKSGKFCCVLNLFAAASRRGKVAGGSRITIACNGGRAALGLGVDFDNTDEQLDHYAAVFSKGLKSVRHKEAYLKYMENAPDMTLAHAIVNLEKFGRVLYSYETEGLKAGGLNFIQAHQNAIDKLIEALAEDNEFLEGISNSLSFD